MSTPTADVSVRIAWADDAEAIAAIQARAWAASYAGLVPAAGDLRQRDFAQLWRDALATGDAARARSSSFPVPDSPEMSTGESLLATRPTSCSTACIGAYCVMISGTPSTRERRLCSSAFSRASWRRSQARLTSTSISAMRYGFDR